jgi:hypothetical protein
MPSILSFDIGTRHLAYCAFVHDQPSTPTHSDSIQITHWQVVDLMSVTGTPYDEACVWVTSKTWKVGQLRAYLDNIHQSSVGTRETLLKRIHTDLKRRGIAKVTSTNLCVLASKLYAYLDEQPWMLACDTIVLENQPCMTNPVMKSVQMLLYGYFLYRGVWQTHQHNTRSVTDSAQSTATPATTTPLPRVMLTSATNKLKVCNTVLTDSDTNTQCGGGNHGDTATDSTTDHPKPSSKSNYKQRKKDAIALANKLLRQWKSESSTPTELQTWTRWIEQMERSCAKEQDDLSDSLLQGLYVFRQHVGKSVTKAKSKGQKNKVQSNNGALV